MNNELVYYIAIATALTPLPSLILPGSGWKVVVGRMVIYFVMLLATVLGIESVFKKVRAQRSSGGSTCSKSQQSLREVAICTCNDGSGAPCSAGSPNYAQSCQSGYVGDCTTGKSFKSKLCDSGYAKCVASSS